MSENDTRSKNLWSKAIAFFVKKRLRDKSETTHAPQYLEWVEDMKDFFQKDVYSVMVPRKSMRTVDVNSSLNEAIEFIKESGFSRVPVQKEKKDNIVGVLHAKDLFFHLDRSSKLTVGDIMRKALFISADQMIYQSLEFLRVNKTHFAVVVDEYGGVDGIITLEDIIEELLGDFQDEFDRHEVPACQKNSDGSYIIGADYTIQEFNEQFGTAFDKEGIETIGGYICDKIGKIGETNDVFETAGHRFEIIESNRRQIIKVRYSKESIAPVPE